MYPHNVDAEFAAAELARMFEADPSLCYSATARPASVSTAAVSEPSASPWPKADGVISVMEGTSVREIAVEFKRPGEGVHGILTAMGQGFAYLHKGYHGSAIVIPESYPTLGTPGNYLRDAIEYVSGSKAVGVFYYADPDYKSASPYQGRLSCARPLELDTTAAAPSTSYGRTSTQWVHVREGSTTRDGYFRFLQCAKLLSGGEPLDLPLLDPALQAAIGRVAPGRDPYEYISNVADTRLLSKAWMKFWFEWVATSDVLVPWVRSGTTYSTPKAHTRIDKDDGSGKSVIWEGRANGLKETLVQELNAGRITEDLAWEQFVAGIPSGVGQQSKQGVRDRAHSYREDMDSSLSQLEWIDAGGSPSETGYKYMSLCERFGPNSGAAKSYLAATLLQAGGYLSLLHYIHRWSEKTFSANPLAYATPDAIRGFVFNEASYAAYLSDLEDKLENDLRVIRKVSGRNRPRRRTVLQAELTFLRSYGFVPQRHRLGVGIPIDWERVMEVVNVTL